MKSNILMMVQGAIPGKVFNISQTPTNLRATEKLKDTLTKEGYIWFKDYIVNTDGAHIVIEIYRGEIEDKIKEIFVEENL
jgi:hypothetical protein